MGRGGEPPQCCSSAAPSASTEAVVLVQSSFVNLLLTRLVFECVRFHGSARSRRAAASKRVPKEGVLMHLFSRCKRQWDPRTTWQNEPRKHWIPYGHRTERMGKHWIPLRAISEERVLFILDCSLTVSNVFPCVPYGVHTVSNVSLARFATWSWNLAAACARGSTDTTDNSCCVGLLAILSRTLWSCSSRSPACVKEMVHGMPLV